MKKIKMALPWIDLRLIFALIVAVLILHACNSTHKIKSSEYKKNDSTGTNSVKNTDVKKADSSSLSIKDSSGSTTLKIEFADEQEADDSDPEEKAIDLAGPKTITPKKSNYQYNLNGIPISSSQPLKSAEVNIKGNISTLDLTNTKASDSGHHENKQAVHVIDESGAKNKKVDTSKFPWVWVIGILSAAVLIYLFFGGRFDSITALFRKKDKSKS